MVFRVLVLHNKTSFLASLPSFLPSFLPSSPSSPSLPFLSFSFLFLSFPPTSCYCFYTIFLSRFFFDPEFFFLIRIFFLNPSPETSYATIETSKSDHFCRTGQRHSQTRTVANSCGKLQTVADGCETSIEYTLSTQTPRVTREPLLRIREQDTLPSLASQEMPRKILRSFFLPV